MLCGTCLPACPPAAGTGIVRNRKAKTEARGH
jgi:hypothetical protein